jgi:hypothetical protein
VGAWARRPRARAARRPHVEQWIDLVILGSRAFVVTDGSGLSVRRWIDAQGTSRRSWPLAAAIAIEALRALAVAPSWHGGIDAHSVRISRSGTVKLVRFGSVYALSQVLDRESLRDRRAAGAETAAGAAPSRAGDVFAIRALLFGCSREGRPSTRGQVTRAMPASAATPISPRS